MATTKWAKKMKKLIITAVIAILGLVWMLYMLAALSIKTQHTSATDYYSAEWIAEFGDAQPNLTTESRVYLEQETARLQAERNGN